MRTYILNVTGADISPATIIICVKASGKFIPWQVKVIATDGSLVE